MTLADLPAARAASIYFLRFRKSGHSTLLVAALNPLGVLGAMGLGLGSLIDPSASRSLGGVDYLSFLAPGMMAAFAMQGGAGESLWPVLGGIKWEGTYIAQIATPLRPIDVLAGQLTFTAMRIAIGTVMTFAAMTVFGAVESWWGILAMPVALLTGLVYASVLTAFAATQETDVAFPMIFRFLIIPSYLFSGTFFPISQLPATLRSVAKVTPLWNGVDLCRSLSLGTATLLGSLAHLAYLLVWLAAGVYAGQRTFRWRLHR
jgi:lipooligosaccharide transport system permease protein